MACFSFFGAMRKPNIATDAMKAMKMIEVIVMSFLFV